MTGKKKLIEVALPLAAINKAGAREKSIRHGHPSTLHLWWARRPLAVCRAVLFAQLVDDPSSDPGQFPTEQDQHRERERLFRIIEDLVVWENSGEAHVLEKARAEIRRCCGDALPPVYDPFSGGGSIPLEAQRLGLPASGSDLNPVAVMIGKAMIEIPPKFAGRKPVNRATDAHSVWSGAQGLAADVAAYGAWMRARAYERIGNLYPKARLPDGSEATVIAWLWARTVESPNPAFRGVQVPLVRSFALSTRKGREAWVRPIIGEGGEYHFEITKDKTEPDGTVNRKGGVCLVSGDPMPFPYIRAEGKAGRMGQKLMAIVCQGQGGRVYLPPTPEMEEIALKDLPEYHAPESDLPDRALGFRIQEYGMVKHKHLFTSRQLVALTTFSDLVHEARTQIEADALAAGVSSDRTPLRDGGTGARAYAEAVSIYLAFAVDKAADYWSSICSWHSSGEKMSHTFGRQALPMVWDFAEANPFSASSGNWTGQLTWIVKCLASWAQGPEGYLLQQDAAAPDYPEGAVLSTDPPYYDNIGYADLSDFFYVWLRRHLRDVYPGIFNTMLVPKAGELVATPYRHGGKAGAEAFFMDGMTAVISRMAAQAAPDYPVTLYYAFKAKELETEGITSTGWAGFLEAVFRSGYAVVATWPMRTESTSGLKTGKNVLASSIVLVCRRRRTTAGTISRGRFRRLLAQEMPQALRHLQESAIAPVDMAQSAIGPGIGIFSRYQSVLEADDRRMSVKTALSLINETVDEILSEQEGDYDDWTRFAVSWFAQYGEQAGPYGEADSIANARGISVQGVVDAGILSSGGGRVQLLSRAELDPDWTPEDDQRLTVWEATQYLIRRHEEGGDHKAAELLVRLGTKAEPARALAYRLHKLCEDKGLTGPAQSYNNLVQMWPDLKTIGTRAAGQTEMNV